MDKEILLNQINLIKRQLTKLKENHDYEWEGRDEAILAFAIEFLRQIYEKIKDEQTNERG